MQATDPATAQVAGQKAGPFLDRVTAGALEAAPTVAAAVAGLLLLILVSRILSRRRERDELSRFKHQTWMLGLTLVALVVVIATLEGGKDGMSDEILKLLGILLSAAIAFSSATLVANAMSGLMLRVQRHFRRGDYIQVGDHYGGVVERGLFFTELQDELRDRITLPNSFLTQNPVTVIRPEETLIEARLSLGYDVSRTAVEPLLVAAATTAGLEEPCFVEILELGDFSIQYRVVGVYTGKLKDLPTARSELRARVLDSLHAAGVEIVSPTFMNQRSVATQQTFVPHVEVAGEQAKGTRAPGKTRFDEAEDAGSIERVSDRLAECDEEIEEINQRLDASDNPSAVEELRRELSLAEGKREALARHIEEREERARKE